MTQRHARIKSLFLAACELEPAPRAAFLDQACGEDIELRREIDSLLEHHRLTTVFQQSSQETADGQIARPRVHWSADEQSDDESPAPRTSGTLIADRYRIVVRLGYGASGEVYRADDLSVGQSVALKFLHREKLQQAEWLHRFREEVRLARTVTHPHVNRVYDLQETETELFISMEYVDGEDLQTLLRRIGRVPKERALQMVRQICLGMFAAHQRGVLHRDLKPANIMVDGRGQIQITDFGIAIPASSSGGQGYMAGTPEYMAPELFAGQRATVQSDVYSSGVVIYELFTGRSFRFSRFVAAREEAGREGLWDDMEHGLPEEIQRLVRWCVAEDPASRPDSALAVAAALPGGDPLTASLAAGETPSPEMIASMTSLERLHPRFLWAYLIAVLLGLAMVVPLSQRTLLLSRADLTHSAADLRFRAQRIIEKLGHEQNRRHQDYGFIIDRGFFQTMIAVPPSQRTWESLASGQPPVVLFWYREGDQRIRPPVWLGDPTLVEQLALAPGMTSVQLDGQGRLIEFAAFLLELPPSDPAEGKPRRREEEEDAFWAPLFELAGLEIDQFKPPCKKYGLQRAPPVFADFNRAWEGRYPNEETTPIRVEAAAFQGRVVYFAVVEPLKGDSQRLVDSRALSDSSLSTVMTLTILFYTTFGTALYMVWRNRTRIHSDYAGATRVALCFLTLNLVHWLFAERHVSVFAEESSAALLVLATSCFKAFACWTYYAALEPFVRRFWPQTLVSWSCVLKGNWRDPVVGRDILAGGLAGVGLVLFLELDSLVPLMLGYPAPHPQLPLLGFDLGSLSGFRYSAALVTRMLSASIVLGLVITMLMMAARLMFRPAWLRVASFSLVLMVVLTLGLVWDAYSPWLANLVIAGCFGLLLTRCGLLSLMVSLLVGMLIVSTPLSLDLEAWQFANTVVTLGVLLALFAASFAIAFRGRVAATS